MHYLSTFKKIKIIIMVFCRQSQNTTHTRDYYYYFYTKLWIFIKYFFSTYNTKQSNMYGFISLNSCKTLHFLSQIVMYGTTSSKQDMEFFKPLFPRDYFFHQTRLRHTPFFNRMKGLYFQILEPFLNL